MEARKEAKLNMFNVVLALCEDHLTIVALVVAFNNSYLALKATVAAITTAAAQLEVQAGGLSTSKKTSKKELARLGSGIAGLVYAYAASINDEEMKEEMNISYTTILEIKDEEVAMVCGNIYTMANEHLADLGDFGVTSGMLSTFNAAIASYVSKAPKPRLSRSHRKALRLEMNGMFDDASGLLKEQMDRLAVNFTTNGNTEFYGTYQEARAIIDPGSYKTVLKILVMNGATNEPLRNVKCYRDTSATAKLSSAKGFATYKNIEEGNHVFKLKHKLFADAAASAAMSHGDKKVVTVLMQAV